MKKYLVLITMFFMIEILFSFSHTFEISQNGKPIQIGYHKKMADPNQVGVPESKWRIYFTNQADTAKIRNIKLRQYFVNSVLSDINFLDEYPFMISSQTFADSATFYANGAQQNCGVLVTVNNSTSNGSTLMTCGSVPTQDINDKHYDFMLTVYTERIKKAIKAKENINMYTLFRHEMLL